MDRTPSIRPEQSADRARIHQIHAAAFPTTAEAALVDRLREVVPNRLSLVAEIDGLVVGHILFTPVVLRQGSAEEVAVGLAPMAVDPEHQRRGIGSILVVAGLEACAARGDTLVFVDGHPEFYPRFGFKPAAPRGFRYIDEGFDPYLFVAELEHGAADGKRGSVEFHPEFDQLENESDGP